MREIDFYYPAGSAGAAAGGRRRMPHLLVFVPGIGGSALRIKNTDKVIWGMEGRVPLRLPELAPPGADLFAPDYEDEVEAYAVMAVSIPFLTRMRGSYHELRAALRRNFDLDELNYLEFPYDWRRPIVISSAALAERIAERLRALRERRPDAKVIIVAHSMGGLVARHYMAHHDPAGDCGQVLTLGTPFRGAVKALDCLVNGVGRGPFRALARMLRRVPAIYELLPIYPIVIDKRGAVPIPAQRVRDLAAALGLDAGRVRTAWEFMDGLNQPCARPWRLRPLAGFGSATPQQAVLYERGRVVVSDRADLLPAEYMEHGSDGGDGTVPIWSAHPGGAPEVSVDFANQTHQGIVASEESLAALIHKVAHAVDTLAVEDPLRGPDDAYVPVGPPNIPRYGPALGVDVADYYAATEPVLITGVARNWAPGRPLWARLDSQDKPQPVTMAANGAFSVDFGLLDEGLHTLTLTDDPDGGAALFHDVVEVV